MSKLIIVLSLLTFALVLTRAESAQYGGLWENINPFSIVIIAIVLIFGLLDFFLKKND